MFTFDRSIIKLNLFHPTSSLVISNPSDEFAALFEVPLNFIKSKITLTLENQNTNQYNQKVEEIRKQDAHKFNIDTPDFKITPAQGIILPVDSQLIKISFAEGEKAKIKQLKRHFKSTSNSSQMHVAYLNIKSSYNLEYNRQVITNKQQINHVPGYKNLRMKQIQTSENFTLKVFLLADQPSITNGNNKISIDTSPITSLNKLKTLEFDKKKSSAESQKTIEFKKKLSEINLNTLTSANYIKNFQNNAAQFQNSKLNQDYKFARGLFNLKQLNQKKQNRQKGQIIQKIALNNQLVQNKPESEIKIHVPITQRQIYQTSETPELRQKKPSLPMISIPVPPVLEPSQSIQESIVIDSPYTRRQIKKIKTMSSSPSTPTAKLLKNLKSFDQVRQMKHSTNRGIELIILAIIAAFFVSLGANFRKMIS